jgi:hypothetical protein
MFDVDLGSDWIEKFFQVYRDVEINQSYHPEIIDLFNRLIRPLTTTSLPSA